MMASFVGQNSLPSSTMLDVRVWGINEIER
jgi:hypothetical protein